MEKSYSEQLRAAQLAGLCAAEETRQWRADRLADAPGPEEGALQRGPGQQAAQGDAAPESGQGWPLAESEGDFWPLGMPEEGWPWPVEEPAMGGAAKSGRQGGKARRRRAQKRRRGAKRSAPGAGRQSARPAGWTDEDVVECRGCWYWRVLDATLGIWACWYPLLEDRLRPCRPADCYRHSGTPYRPCDAAGRPLEQGPCAARRKEQVAKENPAEGREGKGECSEERRTACREARGEERPRARGEKCRGECAEECLKARGKECREERGEECREKCRKACVEKGKERCAQRGKPTCGG